MWHSDSICDLVPPWLVAAAFVGVLCSVMTIGYLSIQLGRWVFAPPPAPTCFCDPDHCICCRACPCKEPKK